MYKKTYCLSRHIYASVVCARRDVFSSTCLAVDFKLYQLSFTVHNVSVYKCRRTFLEVWSALSVKSLAQSDWNAI